MTFIDGMMASWGVCGNCRFSGWLRKKPMLRPKELNAITGDIADELPIVSLCITCFDTPSGFDSPNVEHKKLPAEEYKQP